MQLKFLGNESRRTTSAAISPLIEHVDPGRIQRVFVAVAYLESWRQLGPDLVLGTGQWEGKVRNTNSSPASTPPGSCPTV